MLKSTIENHPVIVFGTAMALGFGAYPGLLAVLDKVTISRSELQNLQSATRTLNLQPSVGGTSRFDYADGFFARTNDGWLEQRNNQTLPFARWKESGVDQEFIYLKDTGRKLILRLPVKGGISSWSSESSPTTWVELTTVQPR